MCVDLRPTAPAQYHWAGSASGSGGSQSVPEPSPVPDEPEPLLPEPVSGVPVGSDPSAPTGFRLDGDAFIPQPDRTLADLGVGHKSLICFRT